MLSFPVLLQYSPFLKKCSETYRLIRFFIMILFFSILASTKLFAASSATVYTEVLNYASGYHCHIAAKCDGDNYDLDPGQVKIWNTACTNLTLLPFYVTQPLLNLTFKVKPAQDAQQKCHFTTGVHYIDYELDFVNGHYALKTGCDKNW